MTKKLIRLDNRAYDLFDEAVNNLQAGKVGKAEADLRLLPILLDESQALPKRCYGRAAVRPPSCPIPTRP
jgi:hypothetical protein